VSKTYVFDIDGTLCTFTDGNYKLCEPLPEHIKIVNRLYAEGNKIILFTARGMDSCDGNQSLAHQKYYQYTFNQLKSWDVSFDQLYLGKPKGDIYVDDLGADLTFFEKKLRKL
jgi:hypothetical protein